MLFLVCSMVALALEPGDLVLQEVHPDPVLVHDSSGEWFEVRNLTDAPIDMEGLILTDGEGSHVIGSSVVVPADGIALFGVADPLVVANGSLSPDYVYPYCTFNACNGMAIANPGDEITIFEDMTVIASYAWSEPPENAGASYALLCDNTYVLQPDGTPGQENDTDRDGDAVPDHCDACVFDPRGEPVDANGCTEFQAIPFLPPWGLALMAMALGAGGGMLRDAPA